MYGDDDDCYGSDMTGDPACDVMGYQSPRRPRMQPEPFADASARFDQCMADQKARRDAEDAARRARRLERRNR